MQLDAVFQTLYDAEVHQHYMQKAVLNGKTREKIAGTEAKPGDRVQFRKYGFGVATAHIPGKNVANLNIQAKPVYAVLEQFDAFDYTDEFTPGMVNIPVVKDAAQIAAQALGRKADQIKIDAINNGFDSTNITVGNDTTALTMNTLVDAKAHLDDNSVDDDNRVFVYHPRQLRDLLKDPTFTNSDYMGDRQQLLAVQAGTGRIALGLEFIKVADRPRTMEADDRSGGLPKRQTSGAYTGISGFVFHKDAVGYAYKGEITTSIDWIAEKRSWLVGGTICAGACVIDDRGICEVKSKYAY